MTVKQIEPLKFKGNKVWYLHKLSEKGADAMKCDFPNGDNTFTETTLQAAIEELAANGGGGGGGSTPSAQPDRVIIIDSTLTEDIPGKAYSTFAAAKAYIESLNTTEKFCIELPAGEFDEQITLDVKWLIHGNNTIITAPINSNIVAGVELTVNPSGVFISDCTVSGGFVGYNAQSQEDLIYVPVYKLNHCRITEFCSASETVDVFGCLCEYCEIETTRSHNELIAEGTSCAYPYAVMTFYSTILQFGASATTAVYGFHTAIRNVGAYSGSFINCVKAYKITTEYSEINIDRLSINNCWIDGFVIKKQDMSFLFVRQSVAEIILESSVTIRSVNVVINSEVIFNNPTEGTATITSNTLYVSPDSVCSNVDGAIWSVINDNRLHYIMYSTDGGQTMSRSSLGATHYGILMYLDNKQNFNPDHYMWLPMPE